MSGTSAGTPLHWLSLTEVAGLIARGELSPVELTNVILERIERLDPGLNAFLQVLGPQARARARQLERGGKQRARHGALYGVPVSVKDLILTRDAPTTAGSRVYGDGIEAEADALVVSRLRGAGAILIGKTNLHEIALGITSVNEHFGPVRNPWEPDRVAGGSSGGSAAAVAAGLGYASIGTDTRGSVRIPAACCGVTGLKPTTGLVPTDGVLPLSWTLDHVGPLTRSIEDAALVLGVITGSRSRAARYRESLRRPVKGTRIGLSEYHLRDLDAEVARAVEDAARELAASGARLCDVEMPELDGALRDSLVIGGAGPTHTARRRIPRTTRKGRDHLQPLPRSRAASLGRVCPSVSSSWPPASARSGPPSAASARDRAASPRTAACVCMKAKRPTSWPEPPSTPLRSGSRPRAEVDAPEGRPAAVLHDVHRVAHVHDAVAVRGDLRIGRVLQLKDVRLGERAEILTETRSCQHHERETIVPPLHGRDTRWSLSRPIRVYTPGDETAGNPKV